MGGGVGLERSQVQGPARAGLGYPLAAGGSGEFMATHLEFQG